MNANLNQYRIFFITASLGNISRAAEELYISQPAISKAISKLEDELSTTLFIRKSRGVVLTDEGRVLFEHLATAFDSIKAGEEKLHRINTLGIGHLKIGASATLCKYVLLPYIKGFIEKYPYIKISIECQSTFHTMKLLESGKIDIALVVSTDDDKHIEFIKTGEVTDVFVATQTYLNNMNLGDDFSGSRFEYERSIFENANIMLLDKDNISRQSVDRYFRENGIEAKHILEVSNMDLLIEFARIGLGAACVIKEFVSDEIEKESITEIKLRKSMKKRTVGFAFIKNTAPTVPLANFIEHIKSFI